MSSGANVVKLNWDEGGYLNLIYKKPYALTEYDILIHTTNIKTTIEFHIHISPPKIPIRFAIHSINCVLQVGYVSLTIKHSIFGS